MKNAIFITHHQLSNKMKVTFFSSDLQGCQFEVNAFKTCMVDHYSKGFFFEEKRLSRIVVVSFPAVL